MEHQPICPRSCWQYWCENPFSTLFICPGCETWTDENGVTRRKGIVNDEPYHDKQFLEKNKRAEL